MAKVRIAAAVALFLLVVLASRFTHAQSTKRLQVQADEAIWGGMTKIAAVCDSGNGAMVYVVYREGVMADNAIAVTSVPNGCRKATAER